MSEVTIYTTQFCPYCVRARSLLKSKNVNYTEIAVDDDRNQRSIMEQRSGRTSVPQIFIDDFHVGGCDDLYALDAAGELDAKLAG
ncbi:MAG: glutaredoxin 3 [Gammaproteobacteria bacterium]|nr:glutaredoxin 3 [Gammaproteobacteria bacterium]